MKAVVVRAPGGPQALEFTELPWPERGSVRLDARRAHEPLDDSSFIGKLVLHP